MYTDINSEDRLVQETFADYLREKHGWDSIYAWNQETFGPDGTLGRTNEREVVLLRDLREALHRLNPRLPDEGILEAVRKLTQTDFSRSTIQHNQEFYGYLRDGVPVMARDDTGKTHQIRVQVIDFRNPGNNRFLAVRELRIQGLRAPHYNRRADLVCFVNGIPLVFIELKAVYVNIRAGFDENLTDYADTIPHIFHHNAFLVVSNGHRARYGSITSGWEHFAEWKRNDERETGSLEATILLDGMLAKDRLLDIVQNFILFDAGKPGGIRKIIGRNHQVLGVNRAVASVSRQEELKRKIPMEARLTSRLIQGDPYDGGVLPLIERAHPDLGRLGVFWHTQGSGKSYSMIFFAEKVKRRVSGNFTFVIMTDRDDLDSQIFRTFTGCGIIDEQTPRASSGTVLRQLLQQNHRYVFSLIHKFNQEVTLEEPYSRRDDIIVISDESHRTQSGKLARNMRVALPNASFIGFTGTPLFTSDHLTRRIFGDYLSRYDFRRSEEDGATVKLIYENRGEKLGLTRLDLNDRIKEKIEEADLEPDQEARLERLLGKDYEVITADDRLDKIADDFVDHCSKRWQSGKSLFVCIDKITCARMYQRILPRWAARTIAIEETAKAAEQEADNLPDEEERTSRRSEACRLRAQAAWMKETFIALIISEGQNEVKDFQAWGFDIIPHRSLMKTGFETADGRRVDVETAFKDPRHPFRIAVVCAMWLTGFDVESLATLYIDKPMKAHTLMQAIARANRVYPGKECGIIVDYNGMLKSLREALADYALGDGPSPDGGTRDPEADSGPGGEVVKPIEAMIKALQEALLATENHLRSLGFDPKRLIRTKGFVRIAALADAVDAVYSSDDAKRRFEILARIVFERFRALIAEPAILPFAERHDNLEAIYKKLQERRDKADVTQVLKEIHKVVNDAIKTQAQGDDQAEGLTFDLSQVDLEKLRQEFGKRVRHKHAVVQGIREIVEKKLQKMLMSNPARMDYYKKYQEIIADYNREKDRVSVEETFERLNALAQSLDEEERRAVREGLSETELALFDLLQKDPTTKIDREKLKQASRQLLTAIRNLIRPMERWTEKEQTQAEVKVFILDWVFGQLPTPPFSDTDKQDAADKVYDYIWHRCSTGEPIEAPTAA